MTESFEDVKVGDKLMRHGTGIVRRYEPVTVTKVSKVTFNVNNGSAKFSKCDGWQKTSGYSWERDYVMHITPELEQQYALQVRYGKLLSLFDKINNRSLFAHLEREKIDEAIVKLTELKDLILYKKEEKKDA